MSNISAITEDLFARQVQYISAEQQQNDGVRLTWTEVLMQGRVKSEWPIKICIYHSWQACKRLKSNRQAYKDIHLSSSGLTTHNAHENKRDGVQMAFRGKYVICPSILRKEQDS